MAVLKNRRSVSPLEYERIFKNLYDYTKNKMRSVPKRRWKYIAKPILDRINSAYVDMMGIQFWPVKGNPQYMAVKYAAVKQALDCLVDIQKPLYVYWSISGDATEDIKRQPDDKRAYWTEMINSEINLLLGILRQNPNYNQDDDIPNNPIHFYSNHEVAKSDLLTELRKLHRHTHAKAVRANRLLSDAEMDILVWLADDAFYHAVEGNRNIPKSKAEYIIRREHFSRMIADLHSMNRPLVSVFSTENYSERVIAEWSSLFHETVKLCYRVQESDKKRFGGLQ